MTDFETHPVGTKERLERAEDQAGELWRKLNETLDFLPDETPTERMFRAEVSALLETTK